MPPKTHRLVPVLLAALLGSAAISMGQVPKTAFQLTAVTPNFYQTPTATSGSYDKRSNGAPSKWLEIQADFDWVPAVKAGYVDDLVFNYYVLLNNANTTPDRKPTMLTGTATLVNIAPQRGMHTSMYVSPHALARFFGGAMRVPGSANTALIDAGVTITYQGQVVAEMSKGTGAWWSQYTATPGVLLPRSETPFAPLGWDYFEETKSKPAQ